jgi:signal transduction histidine kinase
LRNAKRYLPALLPLLLPLGVLALLGSWELGRQKQRAETLLRERAFDFLAIASQRLDAEIAALANDFLGSTLDFTAPTPGAITRAARARHAEVVETFVLEAEGDLVYPPRAPTDSDQSRLLYPWHDMRVAQALLARGDGRGAAAHLEAILARGASERRPIDPRLTTRMRLQLAAIRRGLGEVEQAYATYQELDAELKVQRERSTRRTRSRMRLRWSDFALTEFLCRQALAELQQDLQRDDAELLQLVRDIGSGEFEDVPDDLLVTAMDRIGARCTAPAAIAAHAQARRDLTDVLAARRHARDYDELVEHGLSQQLQLTPADQLVYHAYDTGLSAYLLILRAVRPEESVLFKGDWVGFQIDLTALANRVLAPPMTPFDDGFHLDVLTPAGDHVLHEELASGTDDLHGEVSSRSAVAGLVFQAIPRNAEQQLEARRASARNRALLVLALCATALGGAFFLVRTVGREAELAAMKVDLVSRVSHELKTPLAMIKLYGETLALGRTRTADQSAKFAGIISREADRLTVWVDRFLDFAKREGGTLTYHAERVELSDLIRGVTDAYRPHVDAAKIELVTALEAGLHVHVDPGMMERSVVNLIENAVKYTPESARERRVDVVLSRDGESAVVEVMDRGVGIPAGEEEKIFESFYRASTAGQVRGTGLGLSLVRHFAQAHAGSVEARARDGGGSILRLRLPLTEVEESA